jgi:hypothetical protein
MQLNAGIAPVVAAPYNAPTPLADTPTSPRKRPTCMPGLVGTNAAFLIPDNIRRKFMKAGGLMFPSRT